MVFNSTPLVDNMKNNFSTKTRELFDFGGYCLDWEDGRNDADALHHILKRISNSPFNVAPLNNFRNHMPEGRRNLPSIHSFDVRRKYLLKTKKYLESIWYIKTKEDVEFLQTNKKYYDKSRQAFQF